METVTHQNIRKPGRYRQIVVLLIIFVVIGWGGSRILPYIPGYTQDVKLKSGVYQRSPHVYRYETAAYDPSKAPLSPEWIRLNIDRKNNKAIFESTTGEQVSVNLINSQWVEACENQFRVETIPLPGDLSLGSTTFHKPILIVACEMWAVSEKIRLTRLVLKEGPIPENKPFFFGMDCNPAAERCMSFAESLNELVVTIIDAGTKEPLPDAHITISSGMGIQEFKGSFHLPLYAAMQLEYKISLAGYTDKVGEISNFYENKLEIMYYSNTDHTRGMGDSFDLPALGQEVEYSIELSKIE